MLNWRRANLRTSPVRWQDRLETMSNARLLMALSSMTGFARSHGAAGPFLFEWELKSVNAKGFDFRTRLPPGWDGVEPTVRKRASEVLSRGTVYANLAVKRATAVPAIRINQDVLNAVMKAAGDLAVKLAAPPPTVDGILSIKGVIEVVEPEETEGERVAAEAAVAFAFEAALSSLVDMRRREGTELGRILTQRLEDIGRLAAQAESAAGRRPEAIKARLAEQVAVLLETSERFDADRLHQEAIMIAAKADVREELDRIGSHVSQVRELLAKGGAVGRRLDFLAQEFNREVNTTCSKSNDLELTNIGLELKSVVEQFREQVQNLE
jgi:uncharacterized protein (TIGR00255 family)